MANPTTGENILPETDLDIPTDFAFVDNLLREHNIDADPEVRRRILEITYTLARDKLVEARVFADLTNKPQIGLEDLQIINTAKTEDYQSGPLQLEKSTGLLPGPDVKKSLHLPLWRNCQVGVDVELKKMCVDNVLKRSSKGPPAKMARMRTTNFVKKPT